MLLSPFVLGLMWNILIALGIISLVFLAEIIRRRTMRKIDNLVAFTVGLIIAIVFLWFLPEIIAESDIGGKTLGLLLLAWIFLFYIFELFLHWHHCKDLSEEDHHDHHEHDHGNNTLMFTGTFLHNVLHWVILFSAFSINIQFGIATTLAVFLHAIPQNIANLLMNHKDIRYAYIAAFWGVFWALVTYPFLDFLLRYNFHILAVIWGGLLYTAMSDILPSFKSKGEIQHKIIYLLCMILWVWTFFISSQFTHHEEHDEHYEWDIEHDEHYEWDIEHIDL